MLEGVSIQPGPAPVDSHSESVTVECVACGMAASGLWALLAHWVPVPGGHLCWSCKDEPEAWAAAAVSVTNVDDVHACLRVAGEPVAITSIDHAHDEAAVVRSSLAGLFAAAAKRG